MLSRVHAAPVRALALRSLAAHRGCSSSACLSMVPPTAEDVAVIEQRQLGHKTPAVAVPTGRCRHGHPQAVAYDLHRHRDPRRHEPADAADGDALPPLNSGMFRLTCPLLVRAIDEWERSSGVADLNAQVRASEVLTAELTEAHRGHAAARQALFRDQIDALLARVPAGSAAAKHMELILRSGVAGQTPSKVDVKCLHAQLADHLCRPGGNAIGERILRGLRARGVETDGCADCCNQCSLSVPLDEARRGWWYTPSKNRWKLRKQRVQSSFASSRRIARRSRHSSAPECAALPC